MVTSQVVIVFQLNFPYTFPTVCVCESALEHDTCKPEAQIWATITIPPVDISFSGSMLHFPHDGSSLASSESSCSVNFPVDMDNTPLGEGVGKLTLG